ncbi:hypothetical protein C7B65_13695 [Phormidesmis priestleyi ULC007]|uniref:Uncharacterized protein n=2 Tax=Phormidesmis priestleyi TaxID=268141 RepID=A0A2T1DEC7_9CYAN|nr:hypothetical protein [Phormidesmis priestleyi]PSB18825.1 hypothetical protein C7B65_13695 [Phormidesmis priestleyi ULC007]PZO51036.1 MAG: hypothetical protein DCF14_10120 [Phormidesmis priestleyi]
MGSDVNFESESPEFEQIANSIKKLAEASKGDSVGLLALLRLLESLHREVCEGLFQESLPDNRQALYALLRDIEAKGGWPYIRRMGLQSFLINLCPDAFDGDSEATVSETNSETEAS